MQNNMEKNTQRGMVKWAPFKSLEEQENYIRDAFNKEKEIQMPLLLEDEQEEINSYLCSYRGQLSIVSFYENKRIVTIEGYISKIDVTERIIKVGRKVIPLGMLLKIKEKEQF